MYVKDIHSLCMMPKALTNVTLHKAANCKNDLHVLHI